MIHAAIHCLATQLNEYLCGRLAATEDLVVVSSVVGADGALAPNASNKVAMFLTAIERDPLARSTSDGLARGFAGPGPLFLNLYIMVAANFTAAHYPDALKLLSMVVGFLHEKAVFDHANSPGLDDGIEKLVVDLENMTPQVASNVWGVAGGRYLPSALYRVRMVAIDSRHVSGRVPVIGTPGVSLQVRAGGSDAHVS